MRLLFLIAAVTLTTFTTVAGVNADEELNYRHNDAAIAFAERMAAEHAFDKGYVLSLMADAKKKDSIIKAMNRPAEKVLEWKDYRKIFIKSKRINGGKAFLIKHKAVFDRAEKEYGVPREIIAAIIGVETYYGRIMGNYRVMDALSTLAFDYPKRSPFFTKELENFLLMAREQGFDPKDIKGSYAGAMGLGQFMPSSFRAYAVDFDGSGQIDLWHSPEDAIGSVANYFARHGWVRDAKVTEQPQMTVNFDDSMANDSLKPKHTVASLGEKGFKVTGVASDADASLVKFEGKEGTEHWVGYKNFYVITRYNHSRMYAMAVWQLSEVFAGRLPEE